MTTFNLTKTWQSISTVEISIQSKGPNDVYLYEGAAEPASFEDAFCIPDMKEPRRFHAPAGGNWFAAVKSDNVTKLVVSEV